VASVDNGVRQPRRLNTLIISAPRHQPPLVQALEEGALDLCPLITLWKSLGQPDHSPEGLSSNEPFGSRPEPGAYLIALNLRLPPGEVPEGRARGVQDTATQVQSESEVRGPERETGVTVKDRCRKFPSLFSRTFGIPTVCVSVAGRIGVAAYEL
jgi:hypothetical protein